ncbi:MAG: choice-of-anchor J domain-containing protein [Flavobacterium sp.]
MKKLFYFLNIILLASLVVACTNEDDFAIPDFATSFVDKDLNDFRNYGSGAVEIPLDYKGWVNVNTLGSRVWHVRRNFINNVTEQRYVEFSSFNSNLANDPNDEAWLITPRLDFQLTENEAIEITSRSRFFNGNVLEVLISENFSGRAEDINDAEWTPIEINIPIASSSAIDPFTVSNTVDISRDNPVHIAFRYRGSRQNNPTSTIQISRIKIFENRP